MFRSKQRMIGAVSAIGGKMTDRLETGLVWHRSKRPCESGACAEAAGNDDVVFLRSTLSPDATFALRRDEWEALLFAIKEGDFDRV
jgi:hypothetical protein